MRQSWPEVTLGSFATFKNGLNYSKSDFGKGLKVIGVSDFGDRSRFSDYSQLDQINPTRIKGQVPTLQNGDILFVRSNGNRELIGRSAIMRNLSEPVSFSGFTIRCRFFSDIADPEFFSFLFRSHLIRDVLSNFGGGTNINNLNQEILNGLKVPLPPIATQRKIASILSAYDDLIENNSRRVRVLEQMARDLYREWFIEYRYPGHEQDEFTEDEQGRRPTGWHKRKISELALRRKNGTVYKKEEISAAGLTPVFDQSRAELLGFHNEKADHLASPERPMAIFGDHTCKLEVINQPFSLGPNTIAFIENPLNARLYQLFFAIESAVETQEYKRHWNDLMSKQVLVPPTELAEQFDQKVKDSFQLGTVLRGRNRILRQARDLLLPRLVSGELDVSSLDIRGAEVEDTEAQAKEAIA